MGLGYIVTILLGIGTVVVFVFLALKDDNPLPIPFSVATGIFFGVAIGGLVALIFSLIGAGLNKELVVKSEIPIYSLMDDLGSEDNTDFISASSYSSENGELSYYVAVGDRGNPTTKELQARYTKIEFVDTKPEVIEYNYEFTGDLAKLLYGKKVPMMEKRYTLKLPRGTEQVDLNITN